MALAIWLAPRVEVPQETRRDLVGAFRTWRGRGGLGWLGTQRRPGILCSSEIPRVSTCEVSCWLRPERLDDKRLDVNVPGPARAWT